MAHIFDQHIDDILFSVDMSFGELQVKYDEEMVRAFIQGAVRQNIYSRPKTSEDPHDPFNLTPLLDEYAEYDMYERKFKRSLRRTVMNGWLNSAERQE